MTNCKILVEQLAGISESSAINLPVVENLRRNIRSAHQERNLTPLPINTTAIPVLPIEFQATVSGVQFLFDSGADAADRIILFASARAIHINYLHSHQLDSSSLNLKIGTQLVL